jgi:hypothetical protein
METESSTLLIPEAVIEYVHNFLFQKLSSLKSVLILYSRSPLCLNDRLSRDFCSEVLHVFLVCPSEPGVGRPLRITYSIILALVPELFELHPS